MKSRSRVSLTVLVAAVSVSFFAGAKNSKPEKKAPEVVPGQYVVEIKEDPGFTILNRSALARTLGGAIVDQIRPNMFVLQRDTKETTTRALSLLRENVAVKTVDPNYIIRVLRTPNDSDYSKLWGMSNAGSVDSNGMRGMKGVDIGAEKAWEKTTGSKKVVVAVIDTGIDFKIPDLTDNAWTNLAELNGKPGVDDDGNGYVDDIHGYDFANNDGDPTDDNGHGSHCSGTIGGRGDDGAGVAGVNWNVSLMGVKFLDASGSGTLANGIKAIDYARKNGANILSNSWGGGGYMKTMFDSIELTNKAGQLFVAAAGNDGADNDAQPSYPANYQIANVISVAALDQRGQLADFSNFGKNSVHIAAPGVDIYSTIPGGFEFLSGTSMATPHVAGAAALVLADNPSLTAIEVKQRLLASARPLRSLAGKVSTGGLLDVSYAVLGGTPPQDPNDVTTWANRQPQTVSSVHPYGDKKNETFTVTIPGASRLALHFSRFDTEANYDTVSFFNKAGELLGTMSGSQDDSFSPIADGDTITMKLKSDESVNGYGFDVDAAAFEN